MRDDGYAENLTETGSEDEQPHQRLTRAETKRSADAGSAMPRATRCRSAGDIFREGEAPMVVSDGGGVMAQAFRIPRGARQAHESGVDIMGAGVGDDAGDLALRKHPAWCRTTRSSLCLISSNK